MMPNFKDRKPAIAGSRSFFKIACAAFTSCLVFVCVIWHLTRLVVAIIPEGLQGAKSFPTFAGDMWKLSLTHSVEKTPWEDYFRVNGIDNMTMVYTCFESLGWGYPYAAEDGKLTRTDDGRFKLEMNRSYKSLDLRVSEQAMQHLQHNQDDYDLVALYGQGTEVKIKIQYRYKYLLDIYFSVFDERS